MAALAATSFLAASRCLPGFWTKRQESWPVTSCWCCTVRLKLAKRQILKQIESGAINPPLIGIYVDFAQTALDSLSALYWDIATAALHALARQNIELESLNHPDFIADPAKALQKQVLLPGGKLLQESGRSANLCSAACCFSSTTPTCCWNR